MLDQVNTGVFPEDANAQYYMVNGDDTSVTGNSTKADYCGYHTWATSAKGTTIKLGLIVTDAQQLTVCGYANGGPYDDVSNSAITTLAHEIIETVSDPEPSSATSTLGFAASAPDTDGSYPENGDMCANLDAGHQTLSNGRLYTTYVGPNPYYLQPNLDPATQCCGYPTAVAPSIAASVAASVPGSVAPPSLAASASVPSLLPSTGLSGSPTGAAATPSTSGSVPLAASSVVGATRSNSPYGTYVYPSNAPTSTYQYYGSYCGDGVVDVGEQCDPGDYSFGGSSCCNFFCQYKTVGSICGNTRKGVCYRVPRCARNRNTGAVYCQTNKYRRSGVPCRRAGSTTPNGVCNARGACNAPRPSP